MHFLTQLSCSPQEDSESLPALKLHFSFILRERRQRCYVMLDENPQQALQVRRPEPKAETDSWPQCFPASQQQSWNPSLNTFHQNSTNLFRSDYSITAETEPEQAFLSASAEQDHFVFAFCVNFMNIANCQIPYKHLHHKNMCHCIGIMMWQKIICCMQFYFQKDQSPIISSPY